MKSEGRAWFQEIEEILKKYIDGADLDEEDRPMVKVLCTIGLMNMGISIKRKCLTAITTGTGRGLISTA